LIGSFPQTIVARSARFFFIFENKSDLRSGDIIAKI
jgi:hypothetical protein